MTITVQVPLNILFIVENDPVSGNYAGGSSVYYDQLMMLRGLGHKVKILHFATSKKRELFNRFYADNQQDWKVLNMNDSVIIKDYEIKSGFIFKVVNKILNIFKRAEFPFPTYLQPVYSTIKQTIKSESTELVWAQSLTTASMVLNQKKVPVVFVQHDWIYKIKALKNKGPENLKLRQMEERIYTSTAATMSLSYSEFRDIFNLGMQNSYYVPISYPEIQPSQYAAVPDIVHLGGMKSTANVIGIENFINNVWEDLNIANHRFCIIGDLEGASPTLVSQIKSFKWMGFVPDLSQVLRKGDIQVIPWDKNTGTRTRLPLALANGQVIVAVDESVKCFPELKNGWNCITVPSIHDMAEAIKRVLGDENLRKAISDNAIETVKNHFSKRNLSIRYQSVIASLNLKTAGKP